MTATEHPPLHVVLPNLCCGHYEALIRAACTDGPMARLIRVQLALLDQASKDETLLRRSGYDPETGALADATRFAAVLRTVGPLCCWLGHERYELLVATMGAPCQ